MTATPALRVAGLAVRDFVMGELLGPLGVRDVYVDLPPGLWDGHVPVTGPGFQLGGDRLGAGGLGVVCGSSKMSRHDTGSA